MRLAMAAAARNPLRPLTAHAQRLRAFDPGLVALVLHALLPLVLNIGRRLSQALLAAALPLARAARPLARVAAAPVVVLARLAKRLSYRLPPPPPIQRPLHAVMKAVGGTLPLVPLCKLFAGVIALLWRLVVDPAARVVLYGAHAVRHASPLVLPVLSAHSHAVARAGGHLRRHAARHPLSRSVALAVLATAAGRATLEHNEGLRRSMVFNRKMVPLALEYHFYKWLLRPKASEAERARIFGRLHNRHAPEVLDALCDLRGFYIKIGQVVSSFGDSFVPAPFVDALLVLQDAVPAQPAAYVRALVENELGARVEDLFAKFEADTPLGAASIGQVHAATLANGLDVVVKVQYPDAERYFRNDIRCLKLFCRAFAPENVELMEEIEKQFVTEFDYRLEAGLLRQAAANLMPHFPQLVVPLPVDEQHPFNTVRTPTGGLATLCTPRCLVMERLHGTSLLAAQRAQLERLAKKGNTTVEALRRDLEVKFKAGQLTTPLLPSRFVIGLYTQVLYAASAFRNVANAMVGRPRDASVEPPLNAPYLIELLFDVHGHQLLYDGFFNGDPHPGNILLLDDGKVGLIDWGQVKRLGKTERIKLARLIIALADRDQPLTAEAWAACGFVSAHMDKWCLDRWAAWRFSRMTPDVTAPLGGIVDFERTLGSLDPIVEEPQEYVMAFRLAALLRGSAMGLGDLTVDSARRWRKHAVRLLEREGETPPKTRKGRRLGEDEYLTATEAMRAFRPLAVASNAK